MAISTWRAHDLEQYEKEKTPEDGIENAILCEKYSEAELPFSWDDAIFWLKKSLEIREKLYGKDWQIIIAGGIGLMTREGKLHRKDQQRIVY